MDPSIAGCEGRSAPERLQCYPCPIQSSHGNSTQEIKKDKDRHTEDGQTVKMKKSTALLLGPSQAMVRAIGSIILRRCVPESIFHPHRLCTGALQGTKARIHIHTHVHKVCGNG